MTKVFEAHLTHEEGKIVIEIEALEGLLLRAKSMEEAEEFSRRMIAEWEDIPEDSFSIEFISESAIAL